MSQPSPGPGPVLAGRFELRDLLGSGGMASVYLAWDRAHSRPCAVKVLSDVLSRDEEFRRRFRREAESARSLTHPHIITVYGCGEAGVHHYMAMEYVSGGTLRDALRRRGALREADALRIALEVADALAYAHGRGVVHRDIKPHNVLLTDEGRVKVADFGIARTLDATSLTRTGSLLGSAQYISPEQARGDHATPRSDLYALGVVLFEMLAGRVPFDGEAPVAVALKHLKDPPPDLHQLRPDLSAATVSLTRRLLAKEEEDRPRTAAALAADLRGIASTLVVPSATRAPASETIRLPSAAASPDDAARATMLLAPPPAPLEDAAASTEQFSVRPRARDEDSPTRAAGALRGDGFAETSQMVVPPSRPAEALSRTRLANLVALAVVAVLVGAAYRGTWIASHAAVPRLIGGTVADAAKAVRPLHLGVLVTSQQQDVSTVPGIIVAQDPPPGGGALQGSVVRVTVSRGSGIVPDLRGLGVTPASVRLENAGLRLGRARYISSSQAVGTVVYQFQQPGAHLDPDAPVDILLSEGSPPVLGPLPATPGPSDDTRK